MEKHKRARLRLAWPLAALAAAVLSCNVLSPGAATATPSPLAPPTVVPATVAAASPTPPVAATDTPNAPTPTAVVTAAPTPELPEEAILILEPALTASVTSPVHVAGDFVPTFEQNLVVQVSDAGGIVLATQSTIIQAAGADQRGTFDIDVAFTSPADQPGRISVFDTSARDGGLLHLASVEVTLLASGSAAVVPGQSHQESLLIDAPAAQAVVSGGTLHVTGYSDPVFENQLALVLCGEGGTGTPDLVCGSTDNVVAQGSATVSSPDVGLPGPFAGDLAYTVSAAVQGRLAVYSVSARDGGILHLATVNIQLQP